MADFAQILTEAGDQQGLLKRIFEYFLTHSDQTSVEYQKFIDLEVASHVRKLTLNLSVPKAFLNVLSIKVSDSIANLSRSGFIAIDEDNEIFLTEEVFTLSKDLLPSSLPFSTEAENDFSAIVPNLAQTDEEAYVPASDRVVRLTDNIFERDQVLQNVQQIIDVLETRPNDLNLSAEERTVVLSELSSFFDRMNSGWIRIGELQRAVTKGSPLVWLIDKLGGTLVSATAAAAVTAIGLLLKVLAG